MTSSPEIQGNIKKYLLGQLAGEDLEEIEQRVLTDDEFYEEVQIMEDELVDEYVNSELSADERRLFEKNFLADPESRNKLRLGRALDRHLSAEALRPESKTSERLLLPWTAKVFSSPLRIAAFALIIAAVAFGAWRIFFHQSEVDRGLLALNAAYREQRPVEARISQLNYAPYVTTRGPGDEKIDQTQLRLAELTLLEASTKNPTPAVHHALGKVYLAKRQFDDAIRQFEEALEGEAKNAQLYSDLGAALMEKGKIDRSGREPGKGLEDFARGLENLNKALELSPNLLEALFNRAIVHQNMALPQQAEDDWKKYLEKDPNSKWADEARRYLNDLEERKKARGQKKVEALPEFIEAYKSGSDDKAYELISSNTEAISGQLLWWQLAGAYLDALSKRENNGTDWYLRALAYAGGLQKKRSGDGFVSELARFYRSCPIDQLATLAKAHTMIDEAHALMAKSEAAEALKLYRKAKAGFDKTGDKWDSLFAVYWIGYGQYRRSEFKEGLSVFSQLAEYCRSQEYLWLLEQAITAIGGIRVDLNQFSNAIPYQVQSLGISEKINDAYNTQKILTVIGYTYRNLGNRQQSLAYMQRSLESATTCWPGARQMHRTYDTAAGILNSFGFYTAAAEYEKVALQMALETKDPGFEHRSYTHLGAIYAKLQDYDEALRYTEQGYQLAKAASDQSNDLRSIGLSYLQLGHIYSHEQNYDRATAYYDDAIRLYNDIGLFAFLYEAHKGRLLCYILQGNDPLAKDELQTVLSLFEEHRSKIREEKNRNSFFDLEQTVYDTAIDFEYSRSHDYQKAFEYSEVSRARSLLDLMNSGADPSSADNQDIAISSASQPLTLSAIRERMPDQVQILQYAVLDDKLLVWVISKDKFEVAEQKITSSSLTEKVLNYWQSASTVSQTGTDESRPAGMELYKVLIKPVESILDKNKQICVVPDKVLNRLPFNALISPVTGKYLISDYLLSFAPSSNVFIAASEEARKRPAKKEERLLSVGDPHFDRDAFPDLPDLPSSGKEAEQIGSFYKTACPLIGDAARKQRVRSEMDRADVIHIASHYVIDEHNPMLSKLLLTRGVRQDVNGEPSDGDLAAYEIYHRKLPITRLVALSACRTGFDRYYSGEGMIGMSRTFLAAGVPLVAASLWPVASDPTADLMTSFHRYRKWAGLSSAEALRQAQLDMLNNPQHTYDRPYYWASFVLIGGYASF